MTLIQPNKEQSLLNWLLIGLIVTATFGVIWLIFLYNQTVMLAHGATEMREEAKIIDTRSSELKSAMFTLFDAERVRTIAEGAGMVNDRTPDYARITINEWLAASHF